MRRKTKDKDLARRAKSLVRKWKQLIDEQNGPSSGSVNGEGVAGPPPGGTQYEQNHIGGLGSKSVSPVNSRPGTPSSGKSNISPNLSGRTSAVGSRPGTPLSHQSHVSSPRLGSRPATPGAYEQSNSNNSNSGVGVGPKGGPTATPSSQPPSTTPSASQLSKTNVANKRKRRNDDSPGDLVQERKKHIASLSDKTSDMFSTNQNSESSSARHKLRNANSESVLNGAVPGLHSHNSKHSVQRHDANSNTCDSKSRDMISSSKSYSSTPTATLSTPGSRQISPPSSTYTKPANNNNSKQYSSKSVSPPVPTRRNASVPTRLIQDGDRFSPQDKLLPKTPKVKTTAELIKDMSASRGLKVGSQTATKIVLNQFAREKDDINTPVVPAAAKPRYRRKPGTLPPVSGHTLTQTKSELMEKFLQSQSPQHPVEDVEGIPGLRESPPLSNPTFSENQDEYNEVNEEVTSRDAMHGKMPDKVTFFIGDDTVQQQSSMNPQQSSSDPNAANNINNMSESELWSLLPPLNLAEIDWTSDDYPEVQPAQVTEEQVASLDNQDKLPGVTGQRDIDNEWHDWTQTHSMPSYDGDLIHILPYVNIDD